MFTLAFVLISIAVLVFALSVARRVQRWVDEQKGKLMRSSRLDTEAEARKSDGPLSWLSSLWHFWGFAVAAVGGLKYVIRAWKAAPAGSAEKLGWGLLIALVAAVGLFVVVRLVDQKVNPPQEPENWDRTTADPDGK